jgi:hypothetical protein
MTKRSYWLCSQRIRQYRSARPRYFTRRRGRRVATRCKRSSMAVCEVEEHEAREEWNKGRMVERQWNNGTFEKKKWEPTVRQDHSKSHFGVTGRGWAVLRRSCRRHAAHLSYAVGSSVLLNDDESGTAAAVTEITPSTAGHWTEVERRTPLSWPSPKQLSRQMVMWAVWRHGYGVR